MMDEQRLESLVYEWWSRALEEFLEEHPGEVYFGLAALCNPFDPGFRLCLGCEAPVHRKLWPNPRLSEAERRDDPAEWCYESFDIDRTRAAAWEAAFSPWLDEDCAELSGAEPSRMAELFEAFVLALSRSLIRIEAEQVSGSPRFPPPTDVFVAFEEEPYAAARARYQALKRGETPAPGWGREAACIG